MVHNGVSAAGPVAVRAYICVCVCNALTHGQYELTLLCQHAACQNAPHQLMSVLDCPEVRESLTRKTWGNLVESAQQFGSKEVAEDVAGEALKIAE